MLAHPIAQRRAVLADTSCEYDRVGAVHRRQHLADPAAQTVRVDIEGQPRAIVALFDGGQNLAHVAETPETPSNPIRDSESRRAARPCSRDGGPGRR